MIREQFRTSHLFSGTNPYPGARQHNLHPTRQAATKSGHHNPFSPEMYGNGEQGPELLVPRFTGMVGMQE